MNVSKASLALSRRYLPRLAYSRSMATERHALNSDWEEPHHALRSEHNARAKAARSERGADASTGVKPTISQKYFLVLTRLFRNTSEIPEYVPSPTMQRMHDRMRIVVIITAVALFYSISWTAEWRTRRQMDIDKAKGKVVNTIHDI